jgi:N-acylneuraminate cytidylyltransferase
MRQRVAFLPARIGSKRIPGKNLKLFGGLPIICYVAQALSSSHLVDRIIVSTDDKRLVQEALSQCDQLSVEVISRSPDLSDDHTTSVDVLRGWLAQSTRFENVDVILTYPTSVFLQTRHIEEAVKLLGSNRNLFVATVTESDPVDRLLGLADGRVQFMQPRFADTRTQDLSPTFRDAAQLYLGNSEAWLAGRPFESQTTPLVLGRHTSIDIDTPEDWAAAEALLKVQLSQLRRTHVHKSGKASIST